MSPTHTEWEVWREPHPKYIGYVWGHRMLLGTVWASSVSIARDRAASKFDQEIGERDFVVKERP